MNDPGEEPFAFLSLYTDQEIPAIPLFLSEFDEDDRVYTNRSEIRFDAFKKEECIKEILLDKKDEQGALHLRFPVPYLFQRVYQPGDHAFLIPGAFVLVLNDRKIRERLIPLLRHQT